MAVRRVRGTPPPPLCWARGVAGPLRAPRPFSVLTVASIVSSAVQCVCASCACLCHTCVRPSVRRRLFNSFVFPIRTLVVDASFGFFFSLLFFNIFFYFVRSRPPTYSSTVCVVHTSHARDRREHRRTTNEQNVTVLHTSNARAYYPRRSAPTLAGP